MFRRPGLLVALLAALLAAWWSLQPSPEPRAPPIRGRNNTVLFLTAEARGLCNSHLAAASALLENHPDVQVHYASFAALGPELSRVSHAARARSEVAAAGAPIAWHELRSAPGSNDVVRRMWPSLAETVKAPGMRGVAAFLDFLEDALSPWSAEEHWALYGELGGLVKEVDPAVVVLDTIFRPAVEVARDMNRVQAVVSPNSLAGVFAGEQSWGAMFWKYPAMASGFPFPIPWRLIPSNIYLQLRFIKAMIQTPRLHEKRAFLAERGIQDPINILDLHRHDVPWLSVDFPEAGLPLHRLPPNVTACGPIVLDVAPAAAQDPKLAAWLRRAPTVLVYLGSGVHYDEPRARAMAEALALVLEATDAQVLWKFLKDKGVPDYGDAWKRPLEKFIASGRVRLEHWLDVDPTSLLQTGDIAVSVHHGGANCYFESVQSGVPQVILPLWADLYNFARIAEYHGIGIWPGQETAPEWEPESLSRGFLEALSSDAMREKARALGEVARSYGGRNTAARELAQLAATGY